MIPNSKIERAMKLAREQRMRAEGLDPEEEELKAELRRLNAKHCSGAADLPSPEELKAEGQDIELTRQEVRALMFSGMITFIPVCIVIVVVMCLIVYALFGGFS